MYLSSCYLCMQIPLCLTTVQKSWSFYIAYIVSKSYISRDGARESCPMTKTLLFLFKLSLYSSRYFFSPVKTAASWPLTAPYFLNFCLHRTSQCCRSCTAFWWNSMGSSALQQNRVATGHSLGTLIKQCTKKHIVLFIKRLPFSPSEFRNINIHKQRRPTVRGLAPCFSCLFL